MGREARLTVRGKPTRKSGHNSQITKSSERKLRSIYTHFMRKRDALRSKFASPQIPERHVSIAILEAWADGVVDESRVRRKISECHGVGVTCDRCLESLEYYRKRRQERLTAVGVGDQHSKTIKSAKQKVAQLQAEKA